MTFDKLFLSLAKLKAAEVNGKNILRSITKEQADIFTAFDIQLPDSDTLKPQQLHTRLEKDETHVSLTLLTMNAMALGKIKQGVTEHLAVLTALPRAG